ncbi:MAG TPA: PHB depolymerase family esterase [Rhodanobacteraceae bacterium]|nr:PHB depolymerase family esterase [Rhodanobacteraceae bacterium]
MRRFRWLVGLLPLLALSAPKAATTFPLPAWMCSMGGDVVFRNGFEAAEAVPHDPSNGSGGAYPGNQTRTIAVAGFGNRTFYLRLPPGYAPGHASPLLLVLHGAAGSPAAAATAAQQVRSDWSGWTDSHGFVVLAPVASGSQGGWNPDVDVPVMSAALDDTMARYDIEQTRIDLWGFSAGAHVAHALALSNTDYFAAYGVSAGSLTQYACTDDGNPPPTCSALLSGAHPKIPVDIHLGNQDPLYTDWDAGQDPNRFANGGWVLNQDLFYTLFNGGHTYTIAQLGEIGNHICPFALGP